ncbi:hypothetical protein ACFUIT_19065 [Streptomyces sp. NPDC057239]
MHYALTRSGRCLSPVFRALPDWCGVLDTRRQN